MSLCGLRHYNNSCNHLTHHKGFPMATVKLTTVGNSVGIVLPRELLARLRVNKGDTLGDFWQRLYRKVGRHRWA